ncbi:inositol monophosphatase family protein [Arthrobacter sp. lap29]|uniref:inositol monophosphatase family protein n=1 Tax=Arthrobacter sp. lap29 TaxID=3056122 RepID=UPI0028F74E2A|nr:inositol monophosphatase family protein [Arthrobacter sp. lap29]
MALLESSALSDSELAAKILREAASLAFSIRAQGRTELRAGMLCKGEISNFATAADLAAENHIFNALRAARASDSIVGEEGAGHVGSSGRCWVIDPVDGTYNFASGSSYWCTALALVLPDLISPAGSPADCHPESSTPDPLTTAEVLLGGVFQHEENKLWLGGTTVETSVNGERIVLDPQASLAELSAATYIHPSWLAQPRAAVPWQRAAELPATLRMLGAGSCDLARVAQGELGVWFQHSVPPWDWLPGKGIVEAAGGATAVVRVNGLDWFVAGPPGPVAELSQALQGGAIAH